MATQPMSKGFVCGWDGGGTKTEALCLDNAGNQLAQGIFGPLNLNGAKPLSVESTIRDCVAWMAEQPGGLDACGALVIGTAGVSNQEAVCFVTDAVRACGYAGVLRLLGDQEIALAGAVQGVGAVLVAGTGAICCGVNAAGERVRVGGYGYLIDDEGSGYALGRDILAAVVRARDGRTPPTALTTLVFDALGKGRLEEIITWLYDPTTGKKEIASLAPLLLSEAAQEDHAVQAIEEKAARELALLAITAWKNLRLDHGELALTGSILKRYPRIRKRVEAMCAAACPGASMMEPHGGAAQGAARLALKMKEENQYG